MSLDHNVTISARAFPGGIPLTGPFMYRAYNVSLTFPPELLGDGLLQVIGSPVTSGTCSDPDVTLNLTLADPPAGVVGLLWTVRASGYDPILSYINPRPEGPTFLSGYPGAWTWFDNLLGDLVFDQAMLAAFTVNVVVTPSGKQTPAPIPTPVLNLELPVVLPRLADQLQFVDLGEDRIAVFGLALAGATIGDESDTAPVFFGVITGAQLPILAQQNMPSNLAPLGSESGAATGGGYSSLYAPNMVGD